MSDIFERMNETARIYRGRHTAVLQGLEMTTDMAHLYEALQAVLARHEPTRSGECSSCRAPEDSSWGIPYPCEDVQVIADAIGVEL